MPITARVGDLGIDLTHGKLVQPLAFCLARQLLQRIRSRSDVVDVVFDAHDNDCWLSSPVAQETLILLAGSPHDLAELGSRCKG